MAPLPEHKTVESIGHEGRATTIITAYDCNEYDEDIYLPLIELIATLQKTLAGIPEQYRESAVFHIHAGGEYASASADVSYKRPETDGEYADRKRWLDGTDAEYEARERASYENLKKKYG